MQRFLTAVIFTLSIVIVGLCAVPEAYAATLRGGQNYTLPQGVTLEGDLYVAGKGVVLSGTTTGDAILFGADVKTQPESRVDGDLFIAAGTAVVGSAVFGDVRAAAGELTFRGSTTEDVVVAGGTVLIEPGAHIAGDLIVFAERLVVKGVVEGTLDVHAQSVEMDGVVRGAVTAVVGGSMSLRDTARIGGDFTYEAPRAAFITDGATISGGTNFTSRGVEANTLASTFFGFAFWFIVTLAGSALVYTLLRRRVEESVDAGLNESVEVLVWGLAALILLPLGSFCVMLTLVGIFVGVFGLLLWGLLFVAGLLLGPIFAGTLTALAITKRREVSLAWIAIGAAVLGLVEALPLVGFLIGLMVLILAMGAVARSLYQGIIAQPPSRPTPDTEERLSTPGASSHDELSTNQSQVSHERKETG